MFETFNIEIPEHLISPNKQTTLNKEYFDGKTIIGLMGYGRSGKDSLAKILTSNYGFHRVGFADNIKKDMNLYLKPEVQKNLKETKDINIYQNDINFFTENNDLKKILRPYIIWYGEEMRRLNGSFYWINKAFEVEQGSKIVVSDVRRIDELDVFKDSNIFHNNSKNFIEKYGVSYCENKNNNFETLLFHVSQFQLKDSDELTKATILRAQEEWLVSDTILIDPRIPNHVDFRDDYLIRKVEKIVNKYNIVFSNNRIV